MTEPLIAVTGATGQVGAQLVSELVKAGRRVRALGRDTRVLSRLGAAETAQGSLDDRMYLDKALRGCDAVFAMLPPNRASSGYLGFARRVSDALVAAITASGARQVVLLSSFGAELTEGSGPILALHQLEERLRQLPLALTVLRAAYFLENHLAAIPLLRRSGGLVGPLRPDLAFPQVATRDIAAVAARLLLAGPTSPGSAELELHGAKDYDMRMVAHSLGAAIGSPELPYVQSPPEQALERLLASGLSADVARLMLEMLLAIDGGRIHALQPRSAGTTTPTTLGQFAKVFARAFQSGPARP